MLTHKNGHNPSSRKKDIKESLTQRQKIRVDPYKQGFDHKDNAKGIDLNAIKLCFQVLCSDMTSIMFHILIRPGFHRKAFLSRTIYFSAASSLLQDSLLRQSDIPAPDHRHV